MVHVAGEIMASPHRCFTTGCKMQCSWKTQFLPASGFLPHLVPGTSDKGTTFLIHYGDSVSYHMDMSKSQYQSTTHIHLPSYRSCTRKYPFKKKTCSEPKFVVIKNKRSGYKIPKNRYARYVHKYICTKIW